MLTMMAAMLLAWGQSVPPGADAAFENAAQSCAVDKERLGAIVRAFELGADHTIAEYQPDFVLSDCIADAVRGRGHFVAVVDGGDRIVQVARRIPVMKRMKRDAVRYAGVPLVEIKPGKALAVENRGSVDRIVIVGSSSDLVADPKRGVGLLRAMGEMIRPTGLLGIVDIPDRGGVDVEKLSAIAREAGWEAAGETITGAAGLRLLRFRKV